MNIFRRETNGGSDGSPCRTWQADRLISGVAHVNRQVNSGIRTREDGDGDVKMGIMLLQEVDEAVYFELCKGLGDVRSEDVGCLSCYLR